ncbi:MAG: FHA domain-containing protein [Gammaproteobacteria bacterium]|nr:FHA domain-containing protein [Gammaproteobacteria bacterium]
MKHAIMFSDIVGSTRLYERLGDTAAAECVNQCVSRMSEIARSFEGVVVNTIGDEIMCSFGSADAAVFAANRIHEVFNAGPMPGFDVKLSLRIGIDYGEVVARDDDIFGDVVNVAARISNIAVGNQTIISEKVIMGLSYELRSKTRQYDRITVKGKSEILTLFEVMREDRDVTIMRNSITSTVGSQVQSLHLIYRGKSVTVQSNSKAFVLGRSVTSDLVIEAGLVSRTHAYCVYRREKFILIDQSTNGTFVKTAEGREVYLRREEIPLVGRGSISLGESSREDNGQMLQFICS